MIRRSNDLINEIDFLYQAKEIRAIPGKVSELRTYLPNQAYFPKVFAKIFYYLTSLLNYDDIDQDELNIWGNSAFRCISKPFRKYLDVDFFQKWIESMENMKECTVHVKYMFGSNEKDPLFDSMSQIPLEFRVGFSVKVAVVGERIPLELHLKSNLNESFLADSLSLTLSSGEEINFLSKTKIDPNQLIKSKIGYNVMKETSIDCVKCKIGNVTYCFDHFPSNKLFRCIKSHTLLGKDNFELRCPSFAIPNSNFAIELVFLKKGLANSATFHYIINEEKERTVEIHNYDIFISHDFFVDDSNFFELKIELSVDVNGQKGPFFDPIYRRVPVIDPFICQIDYKYENFENIKSISEDQVLVIDQVYIVFSLSLASSLPTSLKNINVIDKKTNKEVEGFIGGFDLQQNESFDFAVLEFMENNGFRQFGYTICFEEDGLFNKAREYTIYSKVIIFLKQNITFELRKITSDVIYPDQEVEYELEINYYGKLPINLIVSVSQTNKMKLISNHAFAIKINNNYIIKIIWIPLSSGTIELPTVIALFNGYELWSSNSIRQSLEVKRKSFFKGLF